MQCELCGRDCKGGRTALVDGVKMVLCPDCLRYSESGVQTTQPVSPVQRSITPRLRKPQPKDIYKKMEKELVTDWSTKIKKAREKKGLTREALGFRIGERTVTISKIENGDLRPSDKMIEKLEKELEIILLEVVSKVPTGTTHTGTAMTLGDFIRTED